MNESTTDRLPTQAVTQEWVRTCHFPYGNAVVSRGRVNHLLPRDGYDFYEFATRHGLRLNFRRWSWATYIERANKTVRIPRAETKLSVAK